MEECICEKEDQQQRIRRERWGEERGVKNSALPRMFVPGVINEVRKIVCINWKFK